MVLLHWNQHLLAALSLDEEQRVVVVVNCLEEFEVLTFLHDRDVGSCGRADRAFSAVEWFLGFLDELEAEWAVGLLGLAPAIFFISRPLVSLGTAGSVAL